MNMYGTNERGAESGYGRVDEWRPTPGCGIRQVLGAFAIALAGSLAIGGMGGWVVYSEWAAKQAVVMAHERLVGAEAGPVLDVGTAAHGRDLFATACIACHGADGTGVKGLGRNLVNSDFVALQSDEQMLQFLQVGRTNVNPAMPARGGREDLTDADLRDIVTYLRGVQDPRRMPELPEMVLTVAPATESEKAEALELAGGDEELAEYIASGSKLYANTCIACHGAGGVGIKGNGKALAANEFIASLDDDSLLAFIQKGRDPSDPKNTTGVGMPPKGGNPALSEDDLLDIIAYLRTLQTPTTGARGSAN